MAPSRHVLSEEDKERILVMKEEGYVWDDIVDILFVVKWQGYEERSSESIRNVKDYGLLFENYVFDQLVSTSR